MMETRKLMRQQRPKDMCSSTLRLALSLSQAEHAALERLNPESLGHANQEVNMTAWRKFCESPQSDPYKVNTV